MNTIMYVVIVYCEVYLVDHEALLVVEEDEHIDWPKHWNVVKLKLNHKF